MNRSKQAKVFCLISLCVAVASAGLARQSTVMRKEAMVAAKTEGERLFRYHCAPCHAAGPNHPGTAALQFKYNGSVPALLTERKDLSPDMVRYFVRNGVNAMPSFRKTEIGDKDLQALAIYLGK